MGADDTTQPGGLQPGARLGGYQLADQIGHGGMATVYRARDLRLARWVAVKVLARELAADEGFRQRFIRESRSAAAVDHPHIIPIFEAGEADGVLFIAMRYIAGRTCAGSSTTRTARWRPRGRPASSTRSPGRWTRRTRPAWCTGTSSRPTSWSPRPAATTAATMSTCPISG